MHAFLLFIRRPTLIPIWASPSVLRQAGGPLRWINTGHPLFQSVDWARVDAGNFCVVDPADSTALLYLSEREYKIQVRVSQSNDLSLVVLARPGEQKPPVTEDTQHVSSEPLSTSASKSGNQVSNKKHPPANKVSENEFLPPSDRDRRPEATKRLRAWNKILGWSRSLFLPYISSAEDDASRLATISSSNATELLQRWALMVDHWLSRRLSPTPSKRKDARLIAQHLARVLVHKGVGSMIKEMKFSSVIIRRFLAGNRCTNAWELGYPIALSRSGLPKWLPLNVRRSIIIQNEQVLRWIFSVLHCYKGLEGAWKKPDLSSITSPMPEPDPKALSEYEEFCKNHFWPEIVGKSAKEAGKLWVLKPLAFLSSNKNPVLPKTAGPNHSVSILGAALDTVAWGLAPVNYLREYLKMVKDDRTLSLFDRVQALAQSVYPRLEGAYSIITPKARRGSPSQKENRIEFRELKLGKLSLKFEAAGKVRVFAIVDYWTQRALKPLHTWMMTVLSVLPSDATFDQDGSVRRIANQVPYEAHSYDLKSATDLIPQYLYEVCFRSILPSALVDMWLALLADRWYQTPSMSAYKDKLALSPSRERRNRARRAKQRSVLCTDGSDPQWVKYTRGQPMGALSSWPSMAIVHHSLVQFAAFKAKEFIPNQREFWLYRLLGDDITVFLSKVGLAYVSVCETFHVPLGMKVSLVSNQLDPAAVDPQIPLPKGTFSGIPGAFFEFASQFWKGSVNLSPISFKMELSISSPANRIEFAIKALSRFGTMGSSWIARLCRLLLPPALYGESVRSWGTGVLGPVAQTALITAFGPATFLLERLGYQWCTFIPLLLAFANRSALISADQGLLMGQRTCSDADQDTAILFTISFLKTLLGQMRRARDLAWENADTVHEWLEARAEADNQSVTDDSPLMLRTGNGKYCYAKVPMVLEPVLRDHFTTVEDTGVSYDTEMAMGDLDEGIYGMNSAQRDADKLVDVVLRLETMLRNIVSSGRADGEVKPSPSPPLPEEPKALGSESFINLDWLPDKGPTGLEDDLLEGEIVVGGCIVTEEDIPSLLEGDYFGMPPGWTPPSRLTEWIEARSKANTSSVEAPRAQPEAPPVPKADMGSAFLDLKEAFELYAAAPRPSDIGDVLLSPAELAERKDDRKVSETIRAWRELVRLTVPAIKAGGAHAQLCANLEVPTSIGWDWWGSLSALSDDSKKPIV